MAQNAHASVVLSHSRNNQFYRQALEEHPEYVDAVQLRERLLEAQKNLPGVGDVGEPGDNLNAWLEAVVEADAASKARDLKLAALRDRLLSCDRRLESVAITHTEDILSHLDASLQDVMGRVGDVVDRLQGALNPSEVIARGVGDAWKLLAPLRSEYDQLRAAQGWAMAGEDANTYSRSEYLWDDDLASDVMIANLDEVFPHWKRPGTDINMSAVQDDPRPWPTDKIEQLVWLVTSGAQPWIPTLAELQRLHRARAARLDPTINTEPAEPTRIGA